MAKEKIDDNFGSAKPAHGADNEEALRIIEEAAKEEGKENA